MQSALVLNATYEPLSVVSVRRAVCLVLSDKAEILHHDGSEVRSARRCVARPLVVRLRYVVKVPYHRRTALSRRAVFARDEHRCQYCGGHADSIDHVLPRSRGGEHTWDNVAAACRPCNLRKRDRTPDEANMRLARRPATPRELAWVVVAVGNVPEAWKPYLAHQTFTARRESGPLMGGEGTGTGGTGGPGTGRPGGGQGGGTVRAWAVEVHEGDAAAFHARPVELPARRALWWSVVDRPALVLGSSQPVTTVDLAALEAAGVELVRRRSGGAAVLLVPGEVVWADIVVPAGDPLWDDDIGRAAHWLGEAWAEALADCGAPGGAVHRGPMVRTEWSSVVCFAGLGPGEVRLGGRKAVGISQRRTRDWARFQCAAYRRWHPAALVELLAGPRRPSVAELEDLVQPVPGSEADLRSALLARLP